VRVLIDTQALLWWLIDSEHLGSKARRIFLSEEPIISPVVIWEIAIKTNLGKLNADVALICTAIAEAGFERIGFADSHMIALSKLDLHHRDPFDRMLIAQASAENVPLLTSDAKMDLYSVQTIDSRK
jgi:PIN domain nuclease of toxin-antitoxin system